MSLIIKEYMGNNIQFEVRDREVYANATEMCKAFGKTPKDWLRTENTKEYIKELESVRQISLTDIKQGGVDQGTWIHEKLILDLARWLNVKFRVWCDEQIATLLREGQVKLDVPKGMSLDEWNRRKTLDLDRVEELQERSTRLFGKDKGVLSTTIGELNNMSAQKVNKQLESFGIIERGQDKAWYLRREYQYKELAYINGHGKITRWTNKGTKVIDVMINTRKVIDIPETVLRLF